MRYQFVVVGKLKHKFYKQACQHYLERLKRYAQVEVFEVKEGKGTTEEVKQQEGEALLKAAKGRLVSLDEEGKTFRSVALADHITTLETRSVSQLSFVIGGAEGHGEALKAAASESWSLSALTLPHDLARLVLFEQLYRAETIRAGHPYHRV